MDYLLNINYYNTDSNCTKAATATNSRNTDPTAINMEQSKNDNQNCPITDLNFHILENACVTMPGEFLRKKIELASIYFVL